MYDRERDLRGVFTRIAVVLLFLILFFNIYSVAYVGRDWLLALFPGVIWVDCVTDIFCSFLYFLSFFLPVLIFYALSSGKGARQIDFSITLPSPNSFFKTVAILFVSLGTIMAMAYLNSWLVPSFSTVELMDQTMAPYQLVLMMFSSAVIPAFAEELLFRGAILTNLKPYGKGMAIICSALLFGLMHMNAAQFLYATAAGIVLGTVYVSTNSFWLCVLIHFANNLFSVLEAYMFQIFGEETAGLICMLAEILVFAIGALLALVYVIMKKRQGNSEHKIGVFGETRNTEEYIPIEGGLVVKQFFCPAMIIYIVAVALNMVYVLVAQYLMSL